MGGQQALEVQIIGVVADARFRSLIVDLSAAGAEPDIFFPFSQRTDADLGIAVRSADGAPVPLAIAPVGGFARSIRRSRCIAYSR